MSFSNKIKGCLTGYAIGDALGRGTEFMTRREAELRYPEGLSTYDQIIRDVHRSKRRKGDFSSHTEVLRILADSIISRNDIDYMDFARRYKEWFDTQDSDDSDAHTRLVLQQDSYTTDPHATCSRIYRQRGLYEAPNEAMGRSMLIGLWPKDVERNATDNCRLTHWDSRCTAACVIGATVANELLWHRRMIDYDHLVGMATRLDDRVLPYLEKAYHGTLDDFAIDDQETFWYVRKNLGIALWCLWHLDSPEEALHTVVMHGGDAAANAALATGMMGLKYGFSSLPEYLVEGLLESQAINDTADHLTEVLRQAEDGRDTDD